MTTYLFSNNASSTLAGPISSSATSVSLASGTGVLFPNPTTGQAFKLTFVSASNPNTREIVNVTAVSGDTLTIVRGQESTTAQAWNAGDFANHWLTAGSFQNFFQGSYGPTAFNYLGTDTGTANALLVSAWTPSISAATAGEVFLVIKSASANTGACTLNGAPVTWADYSPLIAGDWPASTVAQLFFTGASFVVMSVFGPTVFARKSTAGAPTNIVSFTSSTTWTVPAGVTVIKRIRVWAAGGGGGGAGAVSATAGAGGGSGAYAETNYASVTPGFGITVTIGTGGSGGGSGGTAGSSGGASTFGGLCSAGGGGGGAGSTGGAASPGGAGGTPTVGQFQLGGNGGGTPIALASNPYVSGAGAGAPFVGSSASGNQGTAGSAGTVPGGGGNGGSATGSSGTAGGGGGSGLIMIEY